MKSKDIAAILVALNDELGRLNPIDDVGAFARNQAQILVVLKAFKMVGRIRAEDDESSREALKNNLGSRRHYDAAMAAMITRQLWRRKRRAHG